MSLDRDNPTAAHLYLEDAPIGDYVANLTVNVGYGDGGEMRYHTLNLSELEGLRLHVQNAIDGLRHRMLTDALAGDCKRCRNSRMVDQPTPEDRVVHQGYHCPVCTPRIQRGRAALAKGRPPKKSER